MEKKKNKNKNTKNSYIVALDIGGTNIEGVLFDNKFQKKKEKKIYFTKDESQNIVIQSKKEILKLICDFILELKGDKKISGIGISITDVVNNSGSILGESKIKSLSNFPLEKYLRKKFKSNVAVKNDADCFAFGEQKLGAGKGRSNVVGVIYGTGIGSGIIINDNLYLGSTGSAGEFGHNPININNRGPKCRCGLSDIEAYAAGPNLVRNYIKSGGKIKNPNSKKIFYSKEKIAKQAFNESFDVFARGLAQLQNILNPELIILGGGLSNLPIYTKINKLTQKYTKDGLKQNVKIVKNKLGDSAGVYGAAIIVNYG